jgi:hypothetical protein
MANQNGRPAGAARVPEDEPVDISETPEFQMALAAATSQIHDRIMSEVRSMVAKEREPTPFDKQTELERFARAIAASTAEMADQGTSRKRVAPEILEARAQSRARMETLLEAAQKLKGTERPFYRVRAKCYLGDRLIEPFQRMGRGEVMPTHIYFMSSPNLGMEPLNDAAREIYAAFRGSIAGGDQMLNGKPTPDALGAKPLWVTNNGAIISTPTTTAREHGMVIEPETLSDTPDTGLGPRVGQQVEIVSVDDPRATKIPVLGTIAAPATRGTTSPRLA